MKKRVAFVVQRCGREVNGGAEALCFMIAKQMSKYWDIEVLTTCALDYVTWDNHYPEGKEEIDGFSILRFPAQTRNKVEFDAASEILATTRDPGIDAQVNWMKKQGPKGES